MKGNSIAKLVNLFTHKKTLVMNDILKAGFSEKSFFVAKNTINHSNKKWKDVRIIRKGKKGKSIWQLAQIESGSSVTYTAMMTKGALRKIIFSSTTNLIAVASEKDAVKRLALAQSVANTNQQFLKKVYAVI